MYLVADLGNSSVKIAVFHKSRLIDFERASHEDFLKKIFEKKKEYLISKGIISTVVDISENKRNTIDKELDFLWLNTSLKLPFNISNENKRAIGSDRLALAAAAVNQFPSQNTLVIDAGTCVTYEYISQENNYTCGPIGMGLQMRYKALHAFTSKLPLLNELPDKVSIIADSTSGSIHAAVILGIASEIDEIIYQFKNRFIKMNIVLTGGNANFLANKLKNSIFVNSNFLLEGLNAILINNIYD